jgi:nucleotide-binding universal stress UspA family protein
MDRILVAVDFSAPSRQAFRAAVEVARAFDATLEVVHVISPYVQSGEFSGLLPSVEQSAVRRELQTFVLEEFRGRASEFGKIELKVLDGPADKEIVEEAELSGASLIVVGSHGRSGLERLLVGSVSNRVLSASRVPVLVIHETSEAKFCNVLAAVDGYASTRDVLSTAAEWSKALSARMRVVHVMPGLPERVCVRVFPNSDLRENTRQLMRQVECNVDDAVRAAFPEQPIPDVEYRVGSPTREISALVEEEQFDLVIVGVHQKHGALDFENVAARLAQGCSCAVLIARSDSIPTMTEPDTAAVETNA